MVASDFVRLSHLLLRQMLPGLLQEKVREKAYILTSVTIWEVDLYRQILLNGHTQSFLFFVDDDRNEEKTEDDESRGKGADCCRNLWLTGE